MSLRRKPLITYSNKIQQKTSASLLVSPSPQEKVKRKRLVTLTSPPRDIDATENPIFNTLSPSSHGDSDGDETRPLISADQVTLAALSNGRSSSVSSSEHDSISDSEPLDVTIRRRRAPRSKTYRTLSTLRKSLKLHPTWRIVKPTRQSALASELVREVERGADGFDLKHLLPSSRPLRKLRKRKDRHYSILSRLEVRKGPHPPVEFDKLGFLTMMPFEQQSENAQHIALEQTVEWVENTCKEESSADVKMEDKRLETRSPTRPCPKDVLVYAQLSSISAPVRRHSSDGEDSEDEYSSNSHMTEDDAELGERSGSEDEHDKKEMDSFEEDEELRPNTVR